MGSFCGPSVDAENVKKNEVRYKGEMTKRTTCTTGS